jgi:type I restriction enzyme, S subunit
MLLEKYDSYKDSGVEWLGKIPEDWDIKRIKDVGIVNKESLSENIDPLLEIKYIDIGSVDRNIGIMEVEDLIFSEAPSRAKRVVKKNDTIVSTVRTYLKAIAFIDDEFNNHIASTGFATLTPCKKIFPKFLYRAAFSNYFIERIIANSVGVSYPAINASFVRDNYLLLPDKEIQTKIANFLDKKTSQIDKKIKILKEKTSSYEELKKSLINETVCRGLNEDVELKDSGVEWIGKIPMDWDVDRLKNIFNERIEKNLKEDGEAVTKNILSVMKDIGVINHRDKGNVGNKMAKDITGYKLVYPKDIVVNKMNVLIGSVGISKEFGALSVIYIILKTKEKNCPEFYDYVFRSKYFQKYLRTISTGILEIREAVDTNLFRHQELPNPSKEEQIQIATYLDEKTGKIDAIITKLNNQVTTLTEFRKTLINDIVTGKIKVPQ